MRRLLLPLLLCTGWHLPAAANEPVQAAAAPPSVTSTASGVATGAASPKPALQVVMYGTKECGYCRKSRAHFNRRGIEFVEHDVGVSVEAYDEFEGLGGYVVPMFVINGSISHGYNGDEEMDQRLAAFGW